MVKKGDIVFVNNKGLFSKIIRLVETGKFGQNVPSHIAVVMSVYSNKVMLIEAHLLRGVRMVSLDVYNNHKCWFARVKEDISVKDMNTMLVWFNSQLGIKYDWTALIGIFMRGFFRLLGKKVYDKVRFVRNFLDSKTKFFCSELVCMGFSIIGIRLWRHPFNETTPFDIFRSDKINIYAEENTEKWKPFKCK